MSKWNFGALNQMASGAGSVNQVGEITNTNNIGDNSGSVSVEQIFAAIIAAVEAPDGPTPPTATPAPAPQPVDPASQPTPGAPVASSPVAEDTVAPLQSLACMSLVDQTKPDIQAKAANLFERLVPYAPQIAKGLAVFGSAALESLANRNPIIAGVCAVCKATKDNAIA